MTRLVIALPGLTVAIEKDDEPDPPPSFDADTTADELSAVHPKPLAKTSAPVEQKRRAAR